MLKVNNHEVEIFDTDFWCELEEGSVNWSFNFCFDEIRSEGKEFEAIIESNRLNFKGNPPRKLNEWNDLEQEFGNDSNILMYIHEHIEMKSCTLKAKVVNECYIDLTLKGVIDLRVNNELDVDVQIELIHKVPFNGYLIDEADESLARKKLKEYNIDANLGFYEDGEDSFFYYKEVGIKD